MSEKVIETVLGNVTIEEPPRRPRGRPKKTRTPEEIAKMNAPKRPRGRPKKGTTPTPV